MNNPHQQPSDHDGENSPANSPQNAPSSPITPPKTTDYQITQRISPADQCQEQSQDLENSLAVNKFVLQRELPSSDEEVLIFPDEDEPVFDSEEEEEVWEVDQDYNEMHQLFINQHSEENNYSSESDSDSSSSEEERWKRDHHDWDEDDEDNDSMFRLPKKKICASFYYDDQITLNVYTEMTRKQKRKHFSQLNKTYFESLEIQANYKKMARESQARFEKSNNLPPKPKKSVSFSDVLKVKTFDKEDCPETINKIAEQEKKIIKNIWQFDDQ